MSVNQFLPAIALFRSLHNCPEVYITVNALVTGKQNLCTFQNLRFAAVTVQSETFVLVVAVQELVGRC